MDFNTIRTLANINTRAATLFQEGYTMRQWETAPDTYWVLKPGGWEDGAYIVTLDDRPRCNCPAFEKYGECKHRIAVKQEVGETEAACAAYDAMMKDAESERWGCDPMRF